MRTSVHCALFLMLAGLARAQTTQPADAPAEALGPSETMTRFIAHCAAGEIDKCLTLVRGTGDKVRHEVQAMSDDITRAKFKVTVQEQIVEQEVAFVIVKVVTDQRTGFEDLPLVKVDGQWKLMIDDENLTEAQEAMLERASAKADARVAALRAKTTPQTEPGEAVPEAVD